MADNTVLNLGVGGDTLRTEDVGGGVKIPVSKIHTGANDADGGAVTATNPFFVQDVSGSVVGLLVGGQPVSNANPVPYSDAGGSITVDGSVTVLSGSVTGLLVGGVPAANANPVPVSGTVNLSFGGKGIGSGNPIPVSGTTGPQWSASGLTLSGSITQIVYHTFANPNLSGSNPIVAVQAGFGIRVLSVAAMAPFAVNLTFQTMNPSGVTASIAGLMPLPASGGIVLPNNDHGWFQTNANESLGAGLSGPVAVGLTITWVKA